MANRTDRRRAPRVRAFVDGVGVHRGYPGLFLAAMLISVLALIATHIGHTTVGRPERGHWHLGNDRSFGELLMYFQSGWGAFLLTVAWWRMRGSVLLAWAVVLTYFLLDDMVRLHERNGWAIARAAGWIDAWGSTGGNLGELAYLALVGLVLAALVALAHALSGPGARQVSRRLVVLAGALIFVGIGLDAVAMLFEGSVALDIAFTVLEDGGEIAVLSVIVAYLFRVAHEAAPTTGSAATV